VALAGFLEHRDDLMCDLAQYYGITDMEALPVDKLAGFAYGLPPESRTKMRIAGARIPLETLLLAGIMDRLSILCWHNTKDGHRGSNKPKSILEELTRKPKEERDQLMRFRSGEDFSAAWERIRKGMI